MFRISVPVLSAVGYLTLAVDPPNFPNVSPAAPRTFRRARPHHRAAAG